MKYFPQINPNAGGLTPAEQQARSTYQGIAVAAYNLGCFLGAIFTIFVGNPMGRRMTIFVGSVIMTVGALLQCTSYELPQFIFGRIVTGWGNGMNTSTVRRSSQLFPACGHPCRSHVSSNLAVRDRTSSRSRQARHDRRHAYHSRNHDQLLD